LTSLSVAFVSSIGLTTLILFLMCKFPHSMIISSFILTVILLIGQGVVFILYKAIGAGISLLGVAAMECLLIFSFRKRIPFSALLLESTVSILTKYPSLFIAAGVHLLPFIAYFMLFSVGMMSVYASQKTDNALSVVLSLYLLFSLYWTSEVIKNVLHVTVCGVFATYYFLVGLGASAGPKYPVLASTRRALTYSFGSIAFGSLVIALVELLREVLRSSMEDRSFLGVCVQCMMACIQNLVEYFNFYAFTEVAIYGKSFISASRDTWQLIKRSGAEIIINDNLIGFVFNIIGVCSMVLVGLVGYLVARSFNTLEKNMEVQIGVACGIVGLVIMTLASNLIHSGVASTIVCYCEDPDVLRRTKPELYARFYAANRATFATQNV